MMTKWAGSVRPQAESGGDAMLWKEGGSARYSHGRVGAHLRLYLKFLIPERAVKDLFRNNNFFISQATPVESASFLINT